MRQFLVISGLVAGGVAAWRIGETLSSDAISMGLGILFGMLAGVPAALLVMAASRRRDYLDEDERRSRRAPEGAFGGYGQGYGAQQPPVIVVTAPGMLPHGQPAPFAALEAPGWPTVRAPRQFTVVGDREESVDEW